MNPGQPFPSASIKGMLRGLIEVMEGTQISIGGHEEATTREASPGLLNTRAKTVEEFCSGNTLYYSLPTSISLVAAHNRLFFPAAPSP
jgi:hypothetical protein